MFEKNILTWDNGAKRGWIGPNRCSLCKSSLEMVLHLFIECPFVAKVWNVVATTINLQGIMPQESLESWYKRWKESTGIALPTIPFFYVYFLWWGRNSSIFHNQNIPVEVVVGLIIKLTEEYKVTPKFKKDTIVVDGPVGGGNALGIF